MKVLTIVGARPQFIKAAAVSRELSESKKITEIILHTGQHFDKNMSEVFFEEMNIPRPKYNLNIHGMSHGAMTGQMLAGIETICMDEKPDFVMVYGDTNSTLAGALAAKKLKIKVIHIEAGLRSFNMEMPEEINRVLTDRISDLLFCPTNDAVKNLLHEGVDLKNIIKNGDVMQDAALLFAGKSSSAILETLHLTKGTYLVCTIHRQENTDDIRKLSVLVETLNELNTKTKVVVPIHPRTKNIILNTGLKTTFTIIEPVGYFDMLELVNNCKIILTDSGGLQKESYFFNKFCITLRDETEWTELVTNGYNILTGADKEKILSAFNQLTNREFIKREELYGGGKASSIIKETLEKLAS